MGKELQEDEGDVGKKILKLEKALNC